MPTYDYQCRSCGTVTEVIHAMSEDGPAVCDRCGGELRRVLYPAGIIFKGSGFYRTDSRSNGDSTSSKPSADSTATTSGSKESSAPKPKSGSKDAASSSSGSDAPG